MVPIVIDSGLTPDRCVADNIIEATEGELPGGASNSAHSELRFAVEPQPESCMMTATQALSFPLAGQLQDEIIAITRDDLS